MKPLRAFTLLEVLLAIGLVGMLSAGIFSFMFQMTTSRAAITRRALDGQSADAIIERLESDLMGGIAADSSGNAGISGTSSSLKVLSRGVWLPMKEEDRVKGASDLQGTEYTFEGGSLKARRWDAQAPGGAPGTPNVVSDHVGLIRFRYFDGEGWVESFDSKEMDGLPVAIEVSLWFGAAPADGPETAEASKRPNTREAPKDDPENTARPSADTQRRAAPSAQTATPPDRVRLIVIPDGPTTVWKELR